VNPPKDLPQDLTFTDPLITGRPTTLPLKHEPKPEPVPTAFQKIRDAFIGFILIAAFLAAIYAFSKLIISHH
jgi:hypothetical protein